MQERRHAGCRMFEGVVPHCLHLKLNFQLYYIQLAGHIAQ